MAEDFRGQAMDVICLLQSNLRALSISRLQYFVLVGTIWILTTVHMEAMAFDSAYPGYGPMGKSLKSCRYHWGLRHWIVSNQLLNCSIAIEKLKT